VPDTADNLILRKILNPSKPEHRAILRASKHAHSARGVGMLCMVMFVFSVHMFCGGGACMLGSLTALMAQLEYQQSFSGRLLVYVLHLVVSWAHSVAA
jgi:hypothetical protein